MKTQKTHDNEANDNPRRNCRRARRRRERPEPGEIFLKAFVANPAAIPTGTETIYFRLAFGLTAASGSSAKRLFVDDIVVNGSLGIVPDPNLTVMSAPGIILVEPPATQGITSVTIRNAGAAKTLDVTSLDTGTSGFAVTSAGSFSLALGATAQINVEWDSAASGATPLYEEATLTINSSNHPPVVVDLEAAVLLAHASALRNGNFETPGIDNVSDSDTSASPMRGRKSRRCLRFMSTMRSLSHTPWFRAPRRETSSASVSCRTEISRPT